MPTQPTPTAPAAELRRVAEERLKERHLDPGPARSEADRQRLVHELQVHQIELELQNEELQRARDEMEAELERYSDLYDFAPVSYVTLDREGIVREANLTAAGLLGLERSRLVKRRLGLSVAAPDRATFHDFLKRVFASQGTESCEVTLLREGKPPAVVRIEASVAATGWECRAVIEDLTEQKRAEQDRLILDKLESTGILAGGIAHDFNNLLTVILLHLDHAQTVPLTAEKLASSLEETKQAALMARSLTQQLIAFAQSGAPVRKPTCVARVIQESVRPALSGSRVRSEFALADDLWPVEVDEGQIGQVIRNLVLNAREAMPEGGVVSIRAENVVLGPAGNPPRPPGDHVQVSIADQGRGIGREVLPKIFDPYFSTKRRGTEKGMGLGLTICHTVIQRHGGSIAVKSEPGVGTTFHLYLPASRKPLGEAKASVATDRPQLGKILVMDDEEGVRTLVGRLLQRTGHEVELAQHGQKAVEAYESAKRQGQPFDLVLLDLTVRAGAGGQEAIQALLKVDPTVKAIVMSGHANDPVLLEPGRHGFQGVLAKPFGSRELLEVISQVMETAPGRSAMP